MKQARKPRKYMVLVATEVICTQAVEVVTDGGPDVVMDLAVKGVDNNKWQFHPMNRQRTWAARVECKGRP